MKKKSIYCFHAYEAIRSFGESIHTCKAKIVEAEEDQILVEFNKKTRPRAK